MPRYQVYDWSFFMPCHMEWLFPMPCHMAESRQIPGRISHMSIVISRHMLILSICKFMKVYVVI